MQEGNRGDVGLESLDRKNDIVPSRSKEVQDLPSSIELQNSPRVRGMF